MDYLTAGESEYSVAGVDNLWMIVIDACCPGTVFYRDQKDMSSQVRLRPDATMFKNGALFAKLERESFFMLK